MQEARRLEGRKGGADGKKQAGQEHHQASQENEKLSLDVHRTLLIAIKTDRERERETREEDVQQKSR